jgi:hypothetical protein
LPCARCQRFLGALPKSAPSSSYLTLASRRAWGTLFAKAFQLHQQAGLLLHARFHHEHDAAPPRAAINVAWRPWGTKCSHAGLMRVALHHDAKKPPALFFFKEISHNSLLRQWLGNFNALSSSLVSAVEARGPPRAANLQSQPGGVGWSQLKSNVVRNFSKNCAKTAAAAAAAANNG